MDIFFKLLAVVGPPYDTLEEVIGTRGTKGEGSLREFGVSYREVPVSSNVITLAKPLHFPISRNYLFSYLRIILRRSMSVN